MTSARLTELRAPDRASARTVRWVGVMFALVILLQRFSVPGLPVPMLLPVVLVWVVLATRAGVVELDPRRLKMWAAAVAASASAMLLQSLLHNAPVISLQSWALILVVWLPAVVRFVDRRPITYRLALRFVVKVCSVLAAVCVVMMLIQLLGVPYRDVMADLVPSALLEQGYTISSPIQFDSPIYRANAWIGLEPSTVSYQIGLGLLAAILSRSPLWLVALLTAGMFATVGGSGFFLVLPGIVVLLVTPARRLLIRPLAAIAPIVIALGLTPIGQSLLERTAEVSNEYSSTSLRAIEPYAELWPTWSSDAVTALVGGGAGSSQRIMDATVYRGLVPLPAKIFYDYGLLAGVVLAAFLLFCYVDSISATVAFASFVSMWTIQPGSNIPVFVIPVVLLVTYWAPRAGLRLEDDP